MWKHLFLTIFLVGCSFTNQWINMDGASGTKENIPVDINILVEMAEYCEDIYDNALYEVDNNEFAYNVVQDRGVSIITIRGTNNPKNVLTDLDARPFKDRKLGIQIHRGFRDAAEKLRNEKIEKYALEEHIILTGHSLGGAIAQIMGLWFEDDAYDVQIYTFGSPTVTTTDMGDEMHFRVYIEDDPVPFLPPFPYVHWGVRIDANTLEWAENHPVGEFTKIDGRDHSIKAYLKVLRRHNENI